MSADTAALRHQFRSLHETGLFLMPNPWDIGSARLLEHLGFPALATTSSGHAASLGKHDMHVTRDELVAHVAAITGAVGVPLNVDAERCFATTPAGVAETVHLLAEAGASGCSIEDFDPATDAIDSIAAATERAAAAAEAAHAHGMTLTVRAENLLHGITDLDDTIQRLIAYRDAGGDCVYAPGLRTIADIGRVVTEVGAPVNVLNLPGGPIVSELAAAGVRRVSTGGAFAWSAYGALVRSAEELRDDGTSNYFGGGLKGSDRKAFD